MKHVKSIPFDWETYNKNKDNVVRKYKVVTITGREVTQLTEFECNNDLNLVGVTPNGDLMRTRAEHLYLQYEVDLQEQWVNVYLSPSNRLLLSSETFETKNIAEVIGKAKANYLTTIDLTKAIN
jgi:hypothetical protein